MIAGAAVGGAAIQSLHAQGKSKVYFISESEVVDRAAVAAWNSQAQPAIKAAGGNLVVGEKNGRRAAWSLRLAEPGIADNQRVPSIISNC